MLKKPGAKQQLPQPLPAIGGSSHEDAEAPAGANVEPPVMSLPTGAPATFVASQPVITALKIDDIREDGETQPRGFIDFRAAEEYADEMEAGATFPPLTVFYDGKQYWLADGFHRLKAALIAEHEEIACEVHHGSQTDAQWHSYSANKTNGIRRTNMDKVRALKSALLHSKAQGLSDEQIATHVGVHRNTVLAYRKEMTCTNCASQSAVRTGKDGRTINTGNIGKRKAGPTPRRRELEELRAKFAAAKQTAPMQFLAAIEPPNPTQVEIPLEGIPTEPPTEVVTQGPQPTMAGPPPILRCSCVSCR